MQDSAQRQEGARRTKAWKSLQVTGQLMFFHLAQLGLFLLASGAKDSLLLSASLTTVLSEIFNEKMQPSLASVGFKSCPAAEGGTKFQVNHPPVLTLDSSSTDPFIACTMDVTMVAVKTPKPPSEKSLPGHQERRLHEFPASRLARPHPQG